MTIYTNKNLQEPLSLGIKLVFLCSHSANFHLFTIFFLVLLSLRYLLEWFFPNHKRELNQIKLFLYGSVNQAT